MGSIGSAMYILGAIFWFFTIPLIGPVGLIFAIICVVLALI